MRSIFLISALGVISTSLATPTPQTPPSTRPVCSTLPAVQSDGTVAKADPSCWDALHMGEILKHWASNPPAECDPAEPWATCFQKLTQKTDDIDCTAGPQRKDPRFLRLTSSCPAPIPGKILEGTPDIFYGAQAIHGNFNPPSPTLSPFPHKKIHFRLTSIQQRRKRLPLPSRRVLVKQRLRHHWRHR